MNDDEEQEIAVKTFGGRDTNDLTEAELDEFGAMFQHHQDHELVTVAVGDWRSLIAAARQWLTRQRCAEIVCINCGLHTAVPVNEPASAPAGAMPFTDAWEQRGLDYALDMQANAGGPYYGADSLKERLRWHANAADTNSQEAVMYEALARIEALEKQHLEDDAALRLAIGVTLERNTLEAENKRLREALERIANDASNCAGDPSYWPCNIARAAIGDKP